MTDRQWTDHYPLSFPGAFGPGELKKYYVSMCLNRNSYHNSVQHSIHGRVQNFFFYLNKYL